MILGFIEAHSLDVGPFSNLADGTLGINGFRGVFFWPLGYVIIRVQVEGVQGYNEDQVALVVPDYHFWLLSTGYSGYTHHQLDHQHYQQKWNWWVVSFLEWIEDGPVVKGEATMHQTVDPMDLKEVVKMTKEEEIDAFSSKIIHGQLKTILLRNNMHVMTQSLRGGDGPHLPHSLSVVNMYTKVISGNKQVAVVVKKLTAVPITITKGVKVTQVVAAKVVPLCNWHPELWRS